MIENMEARRKIWLFAGTTEGNLMAESLAGSNVLLDVSVATEYGREGLPEAENISVSCKRLDAEEMYERLKHENYCLVLDATHPFAREVSENIRTACERLKIPLFRILREREENFDGQEFQEASAGKLVIVENTGEAVEFLKSTGGNILVTTGSKELLKFTDLPGFKERVYARVLSLPKVVEECAGLGFYGEHLIAMQGPFSMELNLALLHSVRAAWLVTKESGQAGGFEEKAEAAKRAGAGLVVIGRPEEEGIPAGEALRILREEWGISLERKPRKLFLIGAGPGNPALLTKEARDALLNAQLIAGAPRLADSMKVFGKPIFEEYRPEEILSYLKAHPGYRQIAVVLSGDTGFYSGAKRLLEAFENAEDFQAEVEVVPGISSMNYFFSRQKLSWEDVRLLSLHGREAALVQEVKRNPRVFALAGGSGRLTMICERLIGGGLSGVRVTVGENLSLPEEKIYSGTPEELLETETSPLFVVYIENPEAGRYLLGHGLPDESFIRGKVPMTKMEVRTVSVSKLGLYPGAAVYDVGAGTGSVSVECAGLSEQVRVFAVERNGEALELLEENRRKFGLSNMEIVEGEAPEALKSLPAPTHVFIGGSGGKMKEIVAAVLEKNPRTRFVVNLITLESLASVMEILRSMPAGREEIVQLTAARDKKAGKSHLMTGQNPVWIVSFEGMEKGGEDGR